MIKQSFEQILRQALLFCVCLLFILSNNVIQRGYSLAIQWCLLIISINMITKLNILHFPKAC